MEEARIGRLRAPVLLALVLVACASTTVNVSLVLRGQSGKSSLGLFVHSRDCTL